MQEDTERVSDTGMAVRQLLEWRAQGFYSFRGHRNKDWRLGLHDLPDYSGTKDPLEHTRGQFVKYCKSLATFPVSDNEYWESLFFAQHHGLKTRLLDWSSNPLVGLYFAVCDILTPTADEAMYGCVWAIRVTESRWLQPEDLPGYGQTQPVEWRIRRWSMINPPLITKRILRQSGKFSYHPPEQEKDIRSEPWETGEELKKLEIIPRKENGKIVNPSTEIRQQLGIMNVHFASMFPDSDGVAKYLNNEWRDIAP